MNIVKALILPIAISVSLTACSGNVKKTLGLGKQAPDEFKVVSNQPLSVPPDFRLIKPVPGAKRPQSQELDKQAEAALFKSLEPASNEMNPVNKMDSNKSKGEEVLLSNAGVQKADPNIRDLLKEEERLKTVEVEEEGFFSKLFNFKDDAAAPELNAIEEKKRISEAQQSGEKITGDEASVREKKDTGLLGKIFNY